MGSPPTHYYVEADVESSRLLTVASKAEKQQAGGTPSQRKDARGRASGPREEQGRRREGSRSARGWPRWRPRRPRAAEERRAEGSHLRAFGRSADPKRSRGGTRRTTTVAATARSSPARLRRRGRGRGARPLEPEGMARPRRRWRVRRAGCGPRCRLAAGEDAARGEASPELLHMPDEKQGGFRAPAQPSASGAGPGGRAGRSGRRARARADAALTAPARVDAPAEGLRLDGAETRSDGSESRGAFGTAAPPRTPCSIGSLCTRRTR